MASFNSTFEQDDFEDVPSPFAKAGEAGRQAKNLRQNVFARPVGTAPSEAPTIATTEFKNTPKRAVSVPRIEYLEDDGMENDERVEERTLAPVTGPKPRSKVKTRPKSDILDLLPRIGWAVVAIGLLRLIFMERGIVDYVGMNSNLKDRETELVRIKDENKAIELEINRISSDRSYQRQLAKEHLGVIAADEFLILFAGESQETESAADRPL